MASCKAANSDFAESSIDYLTRIYGTELKAVMDIARSDKKYAIPLNADGEMPAQALYAIQNEMACTLTDILLRRTGIGTLGNPGSRVLETIAEMASKELKWSAERIDSELEKAVKALSLPD